jgi:3'(2'), 5'-bisphosphate nucleotidase
MSSGAPEDKKLIAAIVDIARLAGEDILAIYGNEAAFKVRQKADNSPVTAADEAADRRITQGLRRLTPDIPVISEEEVSEGVKPEITGDRFWLVDPLDGTKEFIKRNGEFTVNIALIEHSRPVLGVVHAPAMNATYWVSGPGAARMRTGDKERAIECRLPPPDGLVVAVSRSHSDSATLDNFLKDMPVVELRPAGSSLKLCLVASGDADLYPRLGPTMEWDIAAGHAVLAAAGGSIHDTEGREFLYGKKGLLNPPFIARGRQP